VRATVADLWRERESSGEICSRKTEGKGHEEAPSGCGFTW
jgi:hypothetical protein